MSGPVAETAARGDVAEGLEVLDLVVRYGTGAGATTAVAGVSLDVPSGVTALLGPSGCGKSSLLRAVAGLEPVAAGDVRWAGRSVVADPVHRRRFGLLFQDGQLFPHRDVAGNVAYGLSGSGSGSGSGSARERRDRVGALLALVGLAGYEARPVSTLSGGERQRVALARALAPRPRLLLLDEPLSALDRGLRERLATDLRDVLHATGTTALLVTHDQDEAATVADAVAVMAAGRLLQVDRPDRLWAAPADAAVAAFLGFEVVVPPDAPAAAALRAAVPAGGARWAAGRSLALAPGALVVAGPAGAAPGAAGDDGLTGAVRAVRVQRGRTRAGVAVAGLVGVAGTPAELTAAVPDGWVPLVGDRVRLTVDPAAVAVVGGAPTGECGPTGRGLRSYRGDVR